MELMLSGRRMTYDLGTGQGVPLVLLHAFPLDRRLFADTARRLTGRARTIVPDLRGFGGSDLGGPFSIADLADDVAHLLDDLGIERAVVAGISMGGYVALAFAARHPARLLGLVLCDTKAGPDTPEIRQARNEGIELVRTQGVSAYVEKQIPRLLSPAASEELRAEVRALGAQRPEAIISGLEALRDRPDRRDELSGIRCPTLVVVGTEDGITPPSEAGAMATAIANAVLIELPGCGHLANLEAPAPFAQALAGFVGRVT
jgi:pimeloyl-ACP methyl ester carboxylesterase